MAKKKTTRVIPFTALPVEEAPLVVLEPPEVAANAVYAFSTKSRCPIEVDKNGVKTGCGSLATRATSTQGSTQYRRCLRPSCRKSYKEIGQPYERFTKL